MSERINTLYKRVGIASYWYPIGLALFVIAVLFWNHLRTGATPDRVAIQILDFPIFWYGICIVGGIALGAYVVAQLAEKRALAIFNEQVPASVQRIRLADSKVPKEARKILAKGKIRTLGKLLYLWGLDPSRLGLNKAGMAGVRKGLEEMPGVEKAWLSDAPWRPWNPDHVWNGIIWCLLLAVIGARLYHVLTPSPSMAAVGIESPLDYFRNPYQLINLRSGGLGIYGGIAGGALGLFLYTRRQRIPMIAWADLAAVGVVLGQVFGRWGNFFNQELYGRPSDLPWAIYIDPVYRLPAYSDVSHFHPAFLYESLWSLLTFIVLLTLVNRYSSRLRTGELTALYLIFYAIGRILLETVRLDSRLVSFGDVALNISVATFLSMVIAVMMAIWLGQSRFRQKRS